MHWTGMVSAHLTEFIRSDHWPPNSPDLLTVISGVHVGSLSQAPSKTEVDRRTQRSVAVDLGQPTVRLLKAVRYD